MPFLHILVKNGVLHALYTPYKGKYDIISITPTGEIKVLKDKQ